MVWLSIRPSPVITRSASATRLSRLSASVTISMPWRSCAPQKAYSAAPMPPAAPPPARPSTSTSRSRAIIRAYCVSAPSRRVIISGVAPFCGPNTAVAPFSPVSGLVTSQATSIRHAASRLSRPLMSMRASFSSSPPPAPMAFPCSSNSFAPSACTIPAPPSLVALPPMPMMICFTPASSAWRISSPVPQEVVFSGLRWAGGTSSRPLAAAISINALLPSPERP